MRSEARSLIRLAPGVLTPGAVPVFRAERLIQSWVAGRSEATIRAYLSDLIHFAGWLGSDTPGTAVAELLSMDHGPASEVLWNYRAEMVDDGLAPASVNRRLAAVRSITSLAHSQGIVNWTVTIKNVAQETYKDTRGPGVDAVKSILAVLRGRANIRGQRMEALRNIAIVFLLYERALRRQEVCDLRFKDVELESATVGRIHVLGKGKTERIPLTLGPGAIEALRDWVDVRGDLDGPLFYRLDRAASLARRGDAHIPMTGQSVYDLIVKLGKKVGAHARPHGLRHSAITRALDLTNGNFRDVQKLSRHANIQTVVRYDDNRSDVGGEVAGKLSEDLRRGN